MLTWEPMTTGEVLPRHIGWRGLLDNDEIVSSTLAVERGAVTLSDVSHDLDTVRCTVSDGKVGRVSIRNQITTLGGRTFEQVIEMDVRDASRCTGPRLPSTADKRQIIDMAMESASLSGYVFDATPEEQFSWLRQLDAMMAEWTVSGLDLDYNAPAIFGQGDLADTAGIPDFALSAVAVSLALRCAPGIGKTLSPEARATLNAGMAAIRTACAPRPDMSLGRGTPRGSGSRYFDPRYPFAASRSPTQC